MHMVVEKMGRIRRGWFSVYLCIVALWVESARGRVLIPQDSPPCGLNVIVVKLLSVGCMPVTAFVTLHSNSGNGTATVIGA